jgi:hypothetical protein
MTPQEKAKYLVGKMATNIKDDILIYKNKYSKECALIAVDQIILANPHSNPLNTDPISTMDYWVEVKQEIEKL